MTETITRILVPVDFSAHADRAVRYAMMLGSRVGARLALLHVVEDPFLTGAWSAEVYVPNVIELLDNLRTTAEGQLARLKDVAVQAGIEAESAVVTGRPAHSIVEYAENGVFDLIVMGTHGRTGLSHAVMGSVAERVMRRAPCPVLTVRAATADAAIAPAAA